MIYNGTSVMYGRSRAGRSLRGKRGGGTGGKRGGRAACGEKVAVGKSFRPGVCATHTVYGKPCGKHKSCEVAGSRRMRACLRRNSSSGNFVGLSISLYSCVWKSRPHCVTRGGWNVHGEGVEGPEGGG